MNSKSQTMDHSAIHLLQYECNSNQLWIQSLDETDLLFKHYDPSLKEESDVKRIKDEDIFLKVGSTEKVKKFTSLKQKIAKEVNNIEIDTPVYVVDHKQYGVIRKLVKNHQQVPEAQNEVIQYEVRLSKSLENVIVPSTELKRTIQIHIRHHQWEAGEQQIVKITVRVDSTVQQLLQYIGQIANISSNFLNIFYNSKKLGQSDILYKENIVDGDQLLCLHGQGEIHTFCRFKNVSTDGWSYSNSYWDSITWRPNRTIMVAGFGVYGLLRFNQNFFVRYRYIVQSTPSEEFEAEVNFKEMDQKSKIIPVMFNQGELVEVPLGSDFTIQIRMYGKNNDFNITGYYGRMGQQYLSIANEDKGLFEIKQSSQDSNGTTVDSGQIPSLYYYVIG